MQITARELYVLGFGTFHVLVFFHLLPLAEQLVSFRSAYTKQAFILGFGIFVSVTLFLLLKNMARIIELISAQEIEVPQLAKQIAEMSVHLLSFLLVSVLLKNFTF